MFEKEAEEKGIKYADNLKPSIGKFDGEEGYSWSQVEEGYENGFKEGAEFGYSKANEWHYVKDELPNHNGQFYVALKGQTETFILNYDYDESDESKMVWLDDDDTNFNDEVYAWHEKLKAPKEIE